MMNNNNNNNNNRNVAKLSNDNNNNNRQGGDTYRTSNANALRDSMQFQDEEDDRGSNAGSVASMGGQSNANTNSTGTGDPDDDISPLTTVIMDVLRKGDAAQLKQAQDGTTPPRSPQNGGYLMESSPLSNANANPNAQLKYKTHQALLKAARAQQVALYSQLDQKSARALIVADPVASQIVWVNEAAERLFGRLDLVGSKLESLMPEEIAVRHAGIIASYRERYGQEYRKSGSAPDSRLIDIVKVRRFTVVRKLNGRDQELRIDAWIRSLRLLDEPLHEPPRLMALEAFEAQQYHEDSADARIFKSALENVSDAIVIADFDGRIEYINKSAELLCGYPLTALKAIRASVNMLVPLEMVTQHEGFLQHFRNNRKATAASLQAKSHEIVVQRRTEMRTAFGKEEILLRVEVAFDKLVGYIKSTREFIPREDFDNERLKLLLPASIVKLLRGATNVSDITSFFWEFDNRTVMFTDVAGFSNWAKNRPVKAVHDRMQPMFAEFEAIIQAFGGELIHRIGDAVMVIFGFNGEERHHARYALACAVELQQWSLNNGFMVRIGLHSGSIGAGIYGSDKGRPSFDAWGPVVNIAKRLEAYGEEGNVHISKQVNNALGHRFAAQLHQILTEKVLTGVKGVQDGEQSFILGVKAADSNQVVLPDKFMQLVGFQKAKFARWRIANEETERRLSELQKAAR